MVEIDEDRSCCLRDVSRKGASKSLGLDGRIILKVLKEVGIVDWMNCEHSNEGRMFIKGGNVFTIE